MKKGIVGNGGFGREVYHSLSFYDKKNCIFFVEDEFYQKGEKILPLSKFDPNEYELIIAIGDPNIRERIVNHLPSKTKYFTHIDKSVRILGDDVNIGEGTIICAGSILTTNIKIGKHSQINLLCTVGHDTTIGDYFTIAPGSNISGNCDIGNKVYIGTNSSVKEKINICDNVIIGLNSGVIKHIENPGTYIGCPTKKIK